MEITGCLIEDILGIDLTLDINGRNGQRWIDSEGGEVSHLFLFADIGILITIHCVNSKHSIILISEILELICEILRNTIIIFKEMDQYYVVCGLSDLIYLLFEVEFRDGCNCGLFKIIHCLSIYTESA